jgi:large subunit ribosomal protein L23
MKLTRYDIIKGPVISDKAYKLNRDKNRLKLRVHNEANKAMIKDAIEKLFNVKVEKVRTLIRKKTKNRATQMRYDASPKIEKEKRAYVTLAEGYSLNLFDQAGASQVDESQYAKTEQQSVNEK